MVYTLCQTVIDMKGNGFLVGNREREIIIGKAVKYFRGNSIRIA